MQLLRPACPLLILWSSLVLQNKILATGKVIHMLISRLSPHPTITDFGLLQSTIARPAAKAILI
jgi:hypothetical protein